MSDLLERIARKGSDKSCIAGEVMQQPALLGPVLAGLEARQANVRYGCDKVLRLLSERQPQILYPLLERFVDQMHGRNTFLKWGAIQIVANLAAVDAGGRIEAALDDYLSPLPGPVLITAANVIQGATRIAMARPELAPRICTALLGVERAQYATPECRNVALGHTIDAFDRILELLPDKKPVTELVQRQLGNPRSGTRRKAERFLKRHGASPP